MAFLNVVFAGVPNFPEPVREAGARLTKDPLFSLGRAHVVLMPGFLGVAVTSFINTFVLLGRPPFPTKIFHALPQATVWLCEKAGLQAEEIARTAGRFRRLGCFRARCSRSRRNSGLLAGVLLLGGAADDDDAVLTAGDCTLDQDHVVFRHQLGDLEVLRGDRLVAVVTGHLEAG